MIGQSNSQPAGAQYQPSSVLSQVSQNSIITVNSQVASNIVDINNSTELLNKIMNKESTLFKDVTNNPNLSKMVGLYSSDDQNIRLNNLGMAVTGIDRDGIEGGKAKQSAVAICDNNPRDISGAVSYDNVVTNRGKEYIHEIIKAETFLDSTNYAAGLVYGSMLRTGVRDDSSDIEKSEKIKVLGTQFETTWNLRLDQHS